MVRWAYHRIGLARTASWAASSDQAVDRWVCRRIGLALVALLAVSVEPTP
ncbi:hypothetical protein [Nocardia bovistercoris]|uniref:Uncharacterized protein n=1 Tax=Nocardia bovistercoris TaxID=2785916 RepID=A0A931IHT4_9NOCA|nr:hypothetical protein [Nocardia bovistercoris]MBH0779965.1 hypothetical protein [Nocardia bovistercoris]